MTRKEKLARSFSPDPVRRSRSASERSWRTINAMNQLRMIFLVSLPVLLTACGGGGGGSSSSSGGGSQPPNNPPTVTVAATFDFEENQTGDIRPTFSDSDGSVVTATWTQIAGPAAYLLDNGLNGAQFTVPRYEAGTSLVLRVTAADNRGATTSRDITVSIHPQWRSIDTTIPFNRLVERGMGSAVAYVRLSFSEAGRYAVVLGSYVWDNDIEVYSQQGMSASSLLGASRLPGEANDTVVFELAQPADVFVKVLGAIGNRFTLSVEPRSRYLEPGFPVDMELTAGTYQSGLWARAVRVGNIDPDPQLEILVSGVTYGPLYAVKANGSPVAGFPREIAAAAQITLGNLDADSRDEIVMGLGPFLGSCVDDQFALDSDGSVMAGWPHQTCVAGMDQMPLLSDLDGDGLDEIVTDHNGIFHPDGSPMSGYGSAAFPFYIQPSLADIDGDGGPEIVYPTSLNGGFAIAAMSHDDSSPPGFPAAVSHAMEANSIGPLGLVDFDGSGRHAIVSIHKPPTAAVNFLYVDATGPDGSPLWSVQTTTNVPYTAAPSFGDLNADGKPEVLVQTSSQLYVWQSNGTPLPGFPVTFPQGRESNAVPLVADVTGDGKPDVILVSAGVILVYSATGVREAQLQVPGNDTMLAVADIDLDGRNEIIAATPFWQGIELDRSSGIWAFDLGGTAHGPVQWGQNGGGKRNTYAFPVPR
jgi:hypothetical protein